MFEPSNTAAGDGMLTQAKCCWNKIRHIEARQGVNRKQVEHLLRIRNAA